MKTDYYFGCLAVLFLALITACNPNNDLGNIPTLSDDMVFDSEPDSAENGAINYFYSENKFYPVDSVGITKFLLVQNIESILHFEGDYKKEECVLLENEIVSDPRICFLAIRFTTEPEPGTYEIIPIHDAINADLLASDRALVPRGKCIGYYGLDINPPPAPDLWDDDFMRSLNPLTGGKVTIEKTTQEYLIRVEGYDADSIRVDVFFEGALNSKTIEFDPNFYF